MIQIDDAGSGSLIGGTGIGILDTETNNYYFEIIPLKYYQTDFFQKKLYQDYVIKIVKKTFHKFNVIKSQPIEVCQGYMFDKLRNWLTINGYNWTSTKIEGPLQYKVENSFNQYVIELGLPMDFVKHARFAFGFHRLLKWVFADMENRTKLCKTQWKSWQKWGNVEKSIYENVLSYSDYCLKCGEKLKPPLNVITIEYTTNKPVTINLHNHCYSGKLREIPPTFLQEFYTTIKTAKRGLDDLNLKVNENLFLKVIQNQLNVVNSQGKLIGCFNNRLGKKIFFWLKKGFLWQCYLKNYSDKHAIILAKMNDQ